VKMATDSSEISTSFKTTFNCLNIYASKIINYKIIEYNCNSGKRGKIDPRSQVLNIGSTVGNLCMKMLQYAPLDDNLTKKNSKIRAKSLFWNRLCKERDIITRAIGEVFWTLVMLSNICHVDLRVSILKKIELNRKKYPVELCKGDKRKYTVYSSQTGITEKEGQSTIDMKPVDKFTHNNQSSYLAYPSICQITSQIRDFSTEREWNTLHTPRSLLLAMIGELGELSEMFQWSGDDNNFFFDEWTETMIDHFHQELADVTIYCLRLADVCGVEDLGRITWKIANEEFNSLSINP